MENAFVMMGTILQAISGKTMGKNIYCANVIIYLACEECEPCDPECYECLETRVNQDTCQDMTYGYQLKFISGNITLSFSEKLDRDLIKNDYTVIDKNGNSIVTEDWVLLKMTDLEYVIQTNLTKSDLPINLQLTFDQKS